MGVVRDVTRARRSSDRAAAGAPRSCWRPRRATCGLALPVLDDAAGAPCVGATGSAGGGGRPSRSRVRWAAGPRSVEPAAGRASRRRAARAAARPPAARGSAARDEGHREALEGDGHDSASSPRPRRRAGRLCWRRVESGQLRRRRRSLRAELRGGGERARRLAGRAREARRRAEDAGGGTGGGGRPRRGGGEAFVARRRALAAGAAFVSVRGRRRAGIAHRRGLPADEFIPRPALHRRRRDASARGRRAASPSGWSQRACSRHAHPRLPDASRTRGGGARGAAPGPGARHRRRQRGVPRATGVPEDRARAPRRWRARARRRWSGRRLWPRRRRRRPPPRRRGAGAPASR